MHKKCWRVIGHMTGTAQQLGAWYPGIGVHIMGRWKGRIWHGSTVCPVECARWVEIRLANCQTLAMRIGDDFHLSVEKYSWFCITALRYWPKKRKTKTTRDSLALVFPRFASAACILFEFWLVHWLVDGLCDWLEWLAWIWFYDTWLKTAPHQDNFPNWWFAIFSSCVYLSKYWNCTVYLDVDHMMSC